MKVYVVPGLWVAAIRGIFLEAGYDLVHSPQEADVVVWTGGADISPKLYGEKEAPETYTDPERDRLEVAVWRSLPKTGGPLKVGICRGAQLLNALSGGRMYQHVEGHGRTHDVMDVATGELITVSSMHHQEMIPPFTAVTWAKAKIATKKVKMGVIGVRQTFVPRGTDYEDVEAVWIPSTESFCFQPHPEIGPKSCTEYFFKLVDKALLAKASLKKKTDTIQVSGLTDTLAKKAAEADELALTNGMYPSR